MGMCCFYFSLHRVVWGVSFCISRHFVCAALISRGMAPVATISHVAGTHVVSDWAKCRFVSSEMAPYILRCKRAIHFRRDCSAVVIPSLLFAMRFAKLPGRFPASNHPDW